MPSSWATELARARTAWPGIDVGEGRFRSYVLERLAPDEGADAVCALQLVELYLCCACAAGSPPALAAFAQRYAPTIRSTLRWLALPPHLVEEAAQALSAQLFAAGARGPMIASYSGRGPLDAWLRIVTARTGRKLLGRAKRLVPSSDERIAEELLAPGASAIEHELMQAQYREPFARAFKQAMTGLTARQLNLLRHRFVDGLAMHEIGAIYRVHHSTVSRWIAEIRAELMAAVQGTLIDDLGLSVTECHSLMRIVHTNLELTLSTALGTSREPPGALPADGAPRR